MDVTFIIAEAPRIYVERIDVNGNTLTQDKVVRREFRLAEGDAFNSLQVKRTTNRINVAGLLPGKLRGRPGRRQQRPTGSCSTANVQEQATGELSLSAGFSSLESFIFSGSIQQRNFRGRGQTVGLGVNYSRYSRSGNDQLHRTHICSTRTSRRASISIAATITTATTSNSTATYKQSTTGAQLRVGVPLTEYASAAWSLYAQLRRHHARRESVLRRPQRRRHTDLRAAACGPLPVRGDRQSSELDPWLLADLQHARQLRAPDARPDRYGSASISPASAARRAMSA